MLQTSFTSLKKTSPKNQVIEQTALSKDIKNQGDKENMIETFLTSKGYSLEKRTLIRISYPIILLKSSLSYWIQDLNISSTKASMFLNVSYWNFSDKITQIENIQNSISYNTNTLKIPENTSKSTLVNYTLSKSLNPSHINENSNLQYICTYMKETTANSKTYIQSTVTFNSTLGFASTIQGSTMMHKNSTIHHYSIPELNITSKSTLSYFLCNNQSLPIKNL